LFRTLDDSANPHARRRRLGHRGRTRGATEVRTRPSSAGSSTRCGPRVRTWWVGSPTRRWAPSGRGRRANTPGRRSAAY